MNHQHLDVTGVAWLAQHVNSRWPRERVLWLWSLTIDGSWDATTQMTWEVHDATMDIFEGGYAAYILQRVERDRSSAVTEAKRQNLLKKELAWLRRGAPARTAKPKFRIDAANALISDVPEIRDPVTLAKMSTTRLGKKVIELEDVGVKLGDRVIVKPFTWRLAPGERTGILGANGAGKTTVLKLLEGSQEPTVGKIGRGSTVNLSLLDQRLATLDHVKNDRVSEVIARHKTTYKADGVEMTPGQLLERLGFSSAHLSARVFELSGGQRRRLQFLLELLREPNVLLLDEPTNDLDTDMLRAMEDLLDTWPGTLIVVSHDRYLLERITDQQYAIVDGEFSTCPWRSGSISRVGKNPHTHPTQASTRSGPPPEPTGKPGPSIVTTRKQRAPRGRKRTRNAGRKIAKLTTELAAVDHDLAASDQADYEGLAAIARKRAGLEAERQGCEEKWLDLEVALEP